MSNWLSDCCGMECKGYRDANNEGICARCLGRTHFSEYFGTVSYEGEVSEPPDPPDCTHPECKQLPQITLVTNCLTRIQDVFNALQHTNRSEKEQVSVLLQIERSLGDVVSQLLMYDKGGGSPPSSGSGGKPPPKGTVH